MTDRFVEPKGKEMAQPDAEKPNGGAVDLPQAGRIMRSRMQRRLFVSQKRPGCAMIKMIQEARGFLMAGAEMQSGAAQGSPRRSGLSDRLVFELQTF